VSIWLLVLISFLHITVGGAFATGFLFYMCAEGSPSLTKIENNVLFTLLIGYTASLVISIGMAIYFYVFTTSNLYYWCFVITLALLIILLGYWTYILAKFNLL
jgi:hypothetical protein